MAGEVIMAVVVVDIVVVGCFGLIDGQMAASPAFAQIVQ